MSIDDGGPAFPQTATLINKGFPDVRIPEVTGGMSLRAWLAGQALAGMCSHRDSGKWTAEEMASDAYGYADVMLTERKGVANE